MTLCEENCELIDYNYTTKKVMCSCNVKYNITDNYNIKFNKNEFFKNFIDVKNFADLQKYDFLNNGKAIPEEDLSFLERVTQAFYQCSFPEYLANRKLTLGNHFDFNDDGRDLL